MPPQDPFDFFKGFLGVDIAKVEQIASLIGRVESSIFKAMVADGLAPEFALRLMRDLHSVVFHEIVVSMPGSPQPPE